MGLLSWLAATPENPQISLNDPEAWGLFGGGSESSSGVRVNRLSALTYSPWWRGINLLAGDVAKLPLHVYRTNGGGKDKAKNHPAYRLLRRKANEYQTAYQFRLQLTGHVISGGNGYAFISRAGDGTPLELWPLDPDVTTPVRVNGKLWYVTKVGNEDRKLVPTDVLHVKGLGFDGLVGYNVVDRARESLGLGIAHRSYGSTYFKKSARPAIVLETPGKMTAKAVEQLRESWDRMHAGLDNSHRTAILDNGLTAKVISFSARDSQLLESAQFSIRDVANFIGIPPHKLGDTSRTGYASLEQENLSYLTESLDQRLVMWEDECWDKLLTEEEKDSESHSVEFLRAALDRADRATRANYFRTALGGAPWMTQNEVRSAENMNPVDGGDEMLNPLNMGDPGGQPTPQQETAPQQPPQQGPPSNAGAAREVAVSIITDTARRMCRRVGAHARRASAEPKKYMDWLDAFCDEHRGVFDEAFQPASVALEAIGSSWSPRGIADKLLSMLHQQYSGVADVATKDQLSSLVGCAADFTESSFPLWLSCWLMPE